jgi:Ohr subfamily peroxiredoxin
MPEHRDPIYTAEARVIGGRGNGHGRSSDGALDVDLRLPREMGGDGGGTNPEQLFAVGYAACFESALGSVARRRRKEQEVGDVAIQARVMLVPTKERTFVLEVELDVRLPSVTDPGEAEVLVRGAHELCPYSNATRGNVDVKLIVNGRELGDASTGLAA